MLGCATKERKEGIVGWRTIISSQPKYLTATHLNGQALDSRFPKVEQINPMLYGKMMKLFFVKLTPKLS